MRGREWLLKGRVLVRGQVERRGVVVQGKLISGGRSFPSATTLSFSNHSFLRQPLFPSATTLSFSNHSFLQQPLFPSATTLSFSNHALLQQPRSPSATTLSFSNHSFPLIYPPLF